MNNRTPPRRGWLVHCTFGDDDLAVCSIEADNGRVAVYCPDDTHFFLPGEHARSFAESLHAAIEVAEQDLAEQSAAG